ncbi:MAG TPA: energy-coupling factor ABC transporter permease [Candidatus Acidoferrales bacterium]|nr:energy-coupling factor ABC transporter permease [Candidatus Acidoferrales bacterium]
MHIPDGFLTLNIIIPTFIITLIIWGISIKKTKLTDHQVPMMGLLTALFFAAMMMNYPIIGGTTAHLLGGATIGLILGPYAGCLSVTIILVLQALLFGDGGLTALGANVLNMGIIGVFVPCIVFIVANKAFKIKSTTALFATIFISAFLSDLTGAISAGIELGLSQPVFQYGLSVAVPAMAINHSIIGVAEGIVTVIIIATLLKLRPDVLANSPILGKLSMFKKEKQITEE